MIAYQDGGSNPPNKEKSDRQRGRLMIKLCPETDQVSFPKLTLFQESGVFGGTLNLVLIISSGRQKILLFKLQSSYNLVTNVWRI